jgi:serine/threonine protein kinase
MSRTSTSALRDGVILNNRYRIVRQIGRGGFGRAYLAEDTQRYRELCVLKEFAPQVESDNPTDTLRDRELRQAEDLFEREAGILYKLNHPQIPKFEALLRTRIDGRRSLFLVQEYIEGMSYWELLKSQGRLSEADVIRMIKEVLPVLDYIHDAELIHRDISPDNLILRDFDQQPALIDFGCVKLAANAVSQSRGNSVTLIGKKGYSPDEQLRRGQATRSSDLYSLAVTAMVLLTGKYPDELYDSRQGQWDWNQATVSSGLKRILTKMLAERPCDRYQSAEQVRQILLSNENNSRLQSFISRVQTLIVAPGNRRSFSRSSSFLSIKSRAISRVTRLFNLPKRIKYLKYRRIKPWHWGIIAAGVVIIPGLISFVLINHRITSATIFNSFNFDHNSASLTLNQQELNLQRKIHRRVKSLSIDASAFYGQVDRIFQEKYPELAGVRLTEKNEHQEYRKTWYQIANSLLTKQERQRQ